MNSLFTKIFLSFWLAMLLLGLTLFGSARLIGGGVILDAQNDLAAQARVAAALWQEGGASAASRWLRGQPAGLRLLLLDSSGSPVLRQRMPRYLAAHLGQALRPGVHRVGVGHLLLVAELPQVTPALYLMRELHARQLPSMPWWLRGLLAAIITGLVSYGLATLLTRRLRRLRDAARAMVAGDLGVRVGQSGGDEVEALARDFDRMSDHVRELLDTQKRLLRDLSHELRSPLARLRIALELAEQDRTVSLQRIAKEADELEHLISDVLALARLESGQSDLERRSVALHELLRQVIVDADFEANARQRHVALCTVVPADTIGDPVLLRSALENVIRNAVRHTASGTTVEVDLLLEHETAIITVRDYGDGVPEAYLGRIFEPFTRIDEARERGIGGYGLGLAITGRAMLTHRGRVSAVNHPEGGLLVTLRLPLTRGETD